MNLAFLHKLRLLGIIEGFSTLILFFIAVPMKYIGGIELATRIAGSIHGFLFVCLVIMFFLGKFLIPISWKLTFGGILGAVIPFGPFWIDHYYLAKIDHAQLSNNDGEESAQVVPQEQH